MTNYKQILTDFNISEFATKNGEFNMDARALLALQAYRSWCGGVVGVASGCREGKYNPDTKSTSNSAHDMWYVKGGNIITIPATGVDITRKGFSTWQLMESVEDFVNEYLMGMRIHGGRYSDFLTHLPPPIFSGRGCYPDTNNQCVHLDMSHLSMNQVLRSKRKGVLRWVRTDKDRPHLKAGYHYAKENETFKQLKARLKI